jgi:hypothetical protein
VIQCFFVPAKLSDPPVNQSHTQKTIGPRATSSALHAANRQAADEVALHGQHHDHDRQRDQGGGSLDAAKVKKL